jgi:hypothetical protein
MFSDPNEPSQEDEGRFIPVDRLQEWHKEMQKKCPQIFYPDDQTSRHSRQHAYGTKLEAFFDDDPKKPVECEVVGLRWDIDFGTKYQTHIKVICNEWSQSLKVRLVRRTDGLKLKAHEERCRVGWEMLPLLQHKKYFHYTH